MVTDRRSDRRFETRAVSAGEDPTQYPAGDVVSPIHLATTFVQDRVGSADEFEYTYIRSGSPTRHALEERLASLEGGEHAVACAAGMGAIGTLNLALLEPGDHVVAFNYLYGGTRLLFDEILTARFDIDVTYVDASDTTAVEDAIRDDTRLLWMESPTNPLLKLCDLPALAELAAANDALLCVDNTFMSPYLQRPLELGADVVVHSTTKYLNGHTDALGGVIVTDRDDIHERVDDAYKYATGAVMAPVDAYLVLRGTKTLPARMRIHEENATAIAAHLADHQAVEAVHYPGLETHPQHDLAREQMDGFGGMVSFELEGGFDEAKRFLESLEEINLAVSLGGVESLISHTPTMTHYYLDQATRDAMGITDSLIRLSVGIEHRDDLIADLDQALGRVSGTGSGE